MTFGEPIAEESRELLVVVMGERGTQAGDKKLAGEIGEFERLVQALRRRHATKRLDVEGVVGSGFQIHI